MIIGAAQAFNEFMRKLVVDRELAGGELTQDEEADRAAQLDNFWWAMTRDEQRRAEDLFSAAATSR